MVKCLSDSKLAMIFIAPFHSVQNPLYDIACTNDRWFVWTRSVHHKSSALIILKKTTVKSSVALPNVWEQLLDNFSRPTRTGSPLTRTSPAWPWRALSTPARSWPPAHWTRRMRKREFWRPVANMFWLNYPQNYLPMTLVYNLEWAVLLCPPKDQ